MSVKKAKVQTVEAIVEQIETMEAVEVKQRGRKTNPNSARQAKLAARAALLEQGFTPQRGRKIDPSSPRQQRLSAMAERKASGAYVGRGRPKMKKE